MGAAVSLPYPLRRPLHLIIVLVSAALGALSFWRTPPSSTSGLDTFVGRPILLIGRVVGYPNGTTNGDSFLLSVRWVQPSGGRAFRCRERVRVVRQKSDPPLTWGDRVSVWGPLMSASTVRHRQRESMGTLFVPQGRSVLLERASPFHPVRWAAAIRDRFHSAFNKYLPNPSAQLLSGVLLGDRPPGLAAFAADFRRSGTYHLLVASGSNVGFALGVWWMVSRWGMWWPRRWAIAGAPGVAFLYALVAGGDPPVLRAAVMAAVGSVGALLGRWDRLEHPLILSGGLLLLWNPDHLSHAGFQMSYAATLAIAVVWGRQRYALEESLEKSMGGRGLLVQAGKWAGQLFITSLAAQVALAPFLLYYFGRFSWVGIGANMVAVPLSGLCLFLGAGLTFLDRFWPAAATVWAVPTRWGADALAGWSHFCAKMPGAEWPLSLNGDQTVALVIGTALGFATLYLNRKRGLILSVISLLTMGAVWSLADPKPQNVLAISWVGGKTPSVEVKTETGGVVFKKGESSRLDSMMVDGRHWMEGQSQWEVLRPEGGEGYALRIDTGQTSALLNFGLTARQQTEWLRRSPRPVDLLSWTGASGGPPKKELLALLRPRWIVYQGSRIPISVRQSGVKVYRSHRSDLHWRADKNTAKFISSAIN